MSEKINHPPHYQCDNFECIEVIEEITKNMPGDIGFLLGNCLKYLWRLGKKNGESPLEDAQKAQWYLNRLVRTITELDSEKTVALEKWREDVIKKIH